MARTKKEAIRNLHSTKSANENDAKKTKEAPKDRKTYRHKNGYRINQEIRNQQRKVSTVIPKASFSRLISEILQNVCIEKGRSQMQFSKEARSALVEAAETAIVEIMQIATVLQSHAKRETLSTSDLKLADVIINTIYKTSSE